MYFLLFNVSLLRGGGQWGEPNSWGVFAVWLCDRTVPMQINVINHHITHLPIYCVAVPLSSILLKRAIDNVSSGDRGMLLFQITCFPQKYCTPKQFYCNSMTYPRSVRNRFFLLKSFVAACRFGEKPGFFGLSACRNQQVKGLMGDRNSKISCLLKLLLIAYLQNLRSGLETVKFFGNFCLKPITIS